MPTGSTFQVTFGGGWGTDGEAGDRGDKAAIPARAIATLELVGPIVPKARPRVTRRGHAFMPSSYRNWKDGAIIALMQQWGDRGQIAVPVAIAIHLRGKHNRAADADNVGGSLMDALVQAGILASDNLRAVPSLTVTLAHGQQPPSALIHLSPCQ